MAKLFSGYARGGSLQSFSPYSRARAITSGSAYVRNAQAQAAQMRRSNAQLHHQFLQQSFNQSQQIRQAFRQVEINAAEFERDQKQQLFDAQLELHQQKEDQKQELFKTLAGVSKTAAEYLVAEKQKQDKAKLEFSENLVIQYGLTGQEVAQLQSMEQGLESLDSRTSPLIAKLRNNGASESDINTLMNSSGYSAYGAALGAVKNAESDYDLYLTSKRNEDVNINGVDMSISSAEAAGDPASLSGIFTKHRQNFINEYLPGYDAAFIAKHAREGFLQAESRRKRGLATKMEDQAREANRITEGRDLVTALKVNPATGYQEQLYKKAGGLNSSTLGIVHNRQHEIFVEHVEDGVINSRAAEKVLKQPIFAKHLNRVVSYEEAFPVKAAEINNAITSQDEERIRVANIARNASLQQGKNLTEQLTLEFANNPESINDVAIDEAQRAVLKTGYIEGANKLAGLRSFSTEKRNDKEYDQVWSKQKALGVYPTTNEILYAGLTPNKMTAELQARKDFEDTGLTKDVQELRDKEINSSLRRLLGKAYGSTTRSLPPTFPSAELRARQMFDRHFRTAYKGDANEATSYALDQLQKEYDKPDGVFRTSKIKGSATSGIVFEPGFDEFRASASPKKVNSLPAIVDAHNNNRDAFRSELFVDSGRVKKFVSELNQGVNRPLPSEFFNISKTLKGKVPMSEILTSQVELARQEDPSIPELNPQIKKIFTDVEKEINPRILSIIQQYPSSKTVDRALVESNIPPIYDRSNPYVSFGQMLEQAGVEDKFIPVFTAIMMGESSGRPGIDTAQSGLDPNKLREYSIGLMQINTKAHMDKLNKLGYTMEDLRNPVKNLKVAMMVWDEWINVQLGQGKSLDEAKQIALDRWGAYRDGRYKQYLPQAQSAWEKHKRQSNLPVHERTEGMNDAAQQWLENNGGFWAR